MRNNKYLKIKRCIYSNYNVYLHLFTSIFYILDVFYISYISTYHSTYSIHLINNIIQHVISD